MSNAIYCLSDLRPTTIANVFQLEFRYGFMAFAIVIRISVGQTLDNLIEELSIKFIVDSNVIRDAVRDRNMFQALHEETMIKVDFHVGEAVEGELDRSTVEEILLGITIPIVSKEDAILSKLLWINKGSHKSRQDIKGMLLRKGEMDLQYIHTQALALRVEHILKELQSELKENKQ